MQALMRCKLPENEALLDLFRTVLLEIKSRLIEAEQPARIAQLQGQAKLILDFLDAIEKSSEILTRLK
jgi:hypothetical protein